MATASAGSTATMGMARVLMLDGESGFCGRHDNDIYLLLNQLGHEFC
jgi:hypothetical protein